MLQLSRHGYYAIERTVYGVRLTIREGLNQEAVAEYGLDMTKHLLELEGRLWGMLLIVEHDAMLTPEGAPLATNDSTPVFHGPLRYRHLATGMSGLGSGQ